MTIAAQTLIDLKQLYADLAVADWFDQYVARKSFERCWAAAAPQIFTHIAQLENELEMLRAHASVMAKYDPAFYRLAQCQVNTAENLTLQREVEQ